MAHKKGLGSSRNGRDSAAKRLGVKLFAGQSVQGGEIIVRQRGTRFRPGDGVGIGKDDTLYARSAGTIVFKRARQGRVVSVLADGGGEASSRDAEGAAAGAADVSASEGNAESVDAGAEGDATGQASHGEASASRASGDAAT
jgi:large subunit ribosomal protein L27